LTNAVQLRLPAAAATRVANAAATRVANANAQREALAEKTLRVMTGLGWRPPTPLEAAVLPLLRPGRAAALSIRAIQERIGPFGDEGRFADAREIKEAVSRLVTDFAMPIGGARGHDQECPAAGPRLSPSRHCRCGGPGYFLVLTPEDAELAARPLIAELRSLSRRVRALAGKKELARLFGQIQLSLDEAEGSGGRGEGSGEAA